jgi:uncharacterized protein YybS (DUF2232 family)
MSQLLASRTVFAGLTAGLTLAGLMLGKTLPVLGAMVLTCAGIPAFLMVLFWGVSWFCAYSVVSLVLAFLWGGLFTSVTLVPVLLFPAAMLGWVISRGVEPLAAIGWVLVASCCCTSLMWLAAPLLFDGGTSLWNISDDLRRQGQLAEKQIRALTPAPDLEEAHYQIFLEQFRQAVEFLALLVPFTLIFVWHLLSVGTLYIGAVILAPRMGRLLTPLPKFSSWKFDWNLIWVLFAGWFLFYGAEYLDQTGLRSHVRLIGANFLAVSKILYFIMGLSLMAYFFEMHQLSKPLRVGLSVLGLVFNQLLVWLGVVDIWMDFRAPKPAAKQTEKEDDSPF